MNASRKVMIVEDDVFLSFVEEKMVSRLGYSVIGIAKSGEELLNKIKQYNPDIILIDVQLAGSMDGIQTVEKLRQRHFNIPVIFISGSGEKELLDRARKVNYVDYLLKPIDEEMLSGPLKKAKNITQNAA